MNRDRPRDDRGASQGDAAPPDEPEGSAADYTPPDEPEGAFEDDTTVTGHRRRDRLDERLAREDPDRGPAPEAVEP